MLRLVSLTEEAINLCAEGISLVYGGMLKKHGLTFYSHIQIVHTSEKDQDLVIGERKDFHVRISYDPGVDFVLKDDHTRQIIMINIIHEALLKLARQKHHLDIEVLNLIKTELIKSPLEFRVKYKMFTHPKDKTLLINVIIHPLLRHFNIYLELEKSEEIVANLLIYKGVNVPDYFTDFFSKGKWAKKEFVLSGKATDMEIHLSLEDYSLKYVSTSGIEGKAPKFELMKADADKRTALEEYLHTLNPAIVAVLMGSAN
ncbi:hypothetical protein PV783_11195 [Chitinophaga sp. CC14]|uniref:hypothetical protein n=1 Tax=Chitinophaga sp. CC14 TaxID=3029199 RepID=UPI003B777633